MSVTPSSTDTLFPRRGGPIEVPVREGLTSEEFATEFLFADRPVVIADALQNWSAVSNWNPEFFRSRFGERTIPIGEGRMSITDFVDRVLAATEDQPAPYLTGTGVGNYLLDLFPELASDIEPRPIYLEPNWLAERFLFPLLSSRLNRGPKAEIFFGGRGSGFPFLHWDSLYFHAFNGQVFGEKEWILYAPDQSEFLYPRSDAPNRSDVNNVFEPDLDRYPLVARATAHTCTVRSGELLFIPAGWWHTTRIHGPSISVAINAANASNWAGVRSELVKKMRLRSRLLAVLLDWDLRRFERKRSA